MFTDADMDRADWRLLQEGAVSLFWKPQVLDAAKDDLKQLGYEILDIECGHGVEHFRAQVSLALRWEEQFGYSPWTGNLDALNDALREYPAPASGRSALALLGFHALAAVDHVQRGGLDLLLGGLLGTLLRAALAVEHVGAGDFVVTAAHQAKFNLVLHVFDVEGAAAWT